MENCLTEFSAVWAYNPFTRAKSRYAEAEPLSRRHLRILAELSEDPVFRSIAVDNYMGLLAAMGLSGDEMLARVRSAIEGEPEESA